MTLKLRIREAVGAGFSGIWLRSFEHEDAMAAIAEVVDQHGWHLLTWNPEDGTVVPANANQSVTGDDKGAAAALLALRKVDLGAEGNRAVLVMRNLHPFLSDPGTGRVIFPGIMQSMQTTIEKGAAEGRHVIVLSYETVPIPLELEKLMFVIDHELPDNDELWKLLTAIEAVDSLPPRDSAEARLLLDAAAGLTRLEAAGAYAMSLTRNQNVQPDTLWELKAGMLKKMGLLDLIKPKSGFNKLGGLNHFKEFALRSLTSPTRSKQVRAKGLMTIGLPGTGKSASAVALGYETGLPVVKLDVGALMGQYIGQTEERTRRALRTIDAMAPCLPSHAKVTLADGRVVEIGSMYDDKEYYERGTTHVVAFDETTLRAVPSTVRRVTRRSYTGLMVTVKTRSGTVTATANHMFPVFRDGRLKWTRADQLAVGDRVAVPTTTTVLPAADYSSLDVLELLPQGKFHVEHGMFETAAASLTGPDWASRRYRAKHRGHWLTGEELQAAELTSAVGDTVTVTYGHGGYGNSTCKLPRYVDEKTAYVAGLLFGDGYFTRRRVALSNTCDQLHAHWCVWAERYTGKTPKHAGDDKCYQTYIDNCYQTYIDNAALARYFRVVSRKMTTAKPQLVRAWLRGLVDAEGGVTDTSKITIGCVRVRGFGPTRQLVRRMLLRAGFATNAKDTGTTIELTGCDATRFFDEIGFLHPNKQDRPKVGNASRVDSVPVGRLLHEIRSNAQQPLRCVNKATGLAHNWENGKHNPSRQRLRAAARQLARFGADVSSLERLCAAEMQWPAIESLSREEVMNQPVYDLVLGNTQARNFVADGLFVHNCILFVDELEKALAGAGGGSADSGVSDRMFGSFLTWLNDHESEVYTIGTCNDIRRLMSASQGAFGRSERFDAVMFVDLPGAEQKRAIWDIWTKHYGTHGLSEAQRAKLPRDEKWTGAEISACCRQATLMEMTLEEAAKLVVPVALTADEQINSLKDWAHQRCLSADWRGVYDKNGEPKYMRPEEIVAAGARPRRKVMRSAAPAR